MVWQGEEVLIERGLFRLSVLLFLVTIFVAPPSWGAAERAMSEKKLLYYGKKAFEEKLYDIATENLETFMEKFPNSRRAGEAAVLLGESYFHLRKYDSALKVYKNLSESRWRRKYGVEIIYWTGECCLKKGEYESARSQFTTILMTIRGTSCLTMLCFRWGNVFTNRVSLRRGLNISEKLKRLCKRRDSVWLQRCRGVDA